MEQDLLTDAHFRAGIRHGFKNSFRKNPTVYIALLRSFVMDWSADIDQVKCPVQIWHGDQDTWSPISMSHAFCQAFPTTPKLHVVQSGEHYSTLAQAVLGPFPKEYSKIRSCRKQDSALE